MAKRSKKNPDIKGVQSEDVKGRDLYVCSSPILIIKDLIQQKLTKCMDMKQIYHNSSWLVSLCLCVFFVCCGVYADDMGTQEGTQSIADLKGVEQLLAIGSMYYADGYLENAVSAYQQAISLDPQNASAWDYLGIALRSLEYYDQATEACYTALNITPDNPEIWYNLGYTYGLSGAYEKEIEAYQEAIRLQPNFSPAWQNLAVAYLDIGDEEASLDALLKVAEYDPDSPIVWFDIGGTYERLGDLKDARVAFEKALEIDEDLHIAKEKIKEIDLLSGVR